MSQPRPTVYDPDFLKYPVLALTSRVTRISSSGIETLKACDCRRANQYTSKFSWGESAGSHARDVFVVAGGRCSEGLIQRAVFVGSDPADLEPAASLPAPRARHAMSTLPDGSVVAVGGVTVADDGCLELARDVLRYDISADRWETIAQLPKRAAKLVAECVGDNLFVIAGDTGPASEPERHAHPATCRDDVQILDLDSLKWSTGAPKPTPETGVTSAVLNSHIYVCSSDPVVGRIDDLVEVYDTSSDSWEQSPNMPTPRTNVPVGFVDGRLYCVNGLGRGMRALSLVEVYDPKSRSWEILDDAPPACHSAAYVNVKGEALYLFGGRV